MKRQTLIWTALPNGIAQNGKLRVSVLLSPRLETNELLQGQQTPVLGQFPDFLNWPQVNIQFKLMIQNGNAVQELKADTLPIPQPLLWKALFNNDTVVESYKFDDYSTRVIRSYPASNVMNFLKQKYTNVALSSPNGFPLAGLLIDQNFFGSVEFSNPEKVKGIKDSLDDKLIQDGAIKPTSPGTEPNTEQDFFQVKLFHTPHNDEKTINGNQPGPKYKQYKQVEKIQNKLDFHQILSTLAKYTRLMRHFGLVLDLEASVPPGTDIPQESEIWVVPLWSPQLASESLTPHTHYTNGFKAKTKTLDSEIRDGTLDLTSDKYEIIQVDVDGAAIKAMNLASSIALSKHKPAPDTPISYSLPSLQSAGFSLVRIGRGYKLKLDLANSKKNNDNLANNNIGLFAEDLVRGYRVDIFNELAGNWYSLCDRIGTYNFIDAAIENLVLEEDEGYVSLGVTESATGKIDPAFPLSLPELYVPESMFRWSGWSLCVPRPTTRLNSKNEPEKYQHDVPAAGTDFVLGTELRLLTSFSVKKNSLPRLRFGNNYRMRVRVADLAGNSLSKEEADSKFATKSIRYMRYEPISAPAIVPRQSLQSSPGESSEVLVIRTFNDSPEKDLIEPSPDEKSERHVVPPLCSPSMAEAHGKFDDATGLKKDAYNIIISKEGTLHKVHPDAKLNLPYLPEPLARGASFLGLPGKVKGLTGLFGAQSNKEVVLGSDGGIQSIDLPSFEDPPISLTKVDFGTDNEWPKSKPFILRAEGILAGKPPIKPIWDSGARIITVKLPQAEITKTRLASYPSKDDLNILGIWDWIVSASLTKEQLAKLGYKTKEELIEKLTYYAIQGRHWMLTPYRDIKLVHAVQQPLGIPKFSNELVSRRNIGDTYVTISDDPNIHIKSTGSIDVVGEWDEVIDDLSLAKPVSVKRNAHAFRLSVEYPDPTDPKEKNPKKINQSHEFGDTKYRKVTYKLISTTRFQEYFSSNAPDLPGKFTRNSAPISLDILSSARPEAPKVLYVIPTFGWDRISEGNKIKSKRLGGGLRVYLQRPWFSSGDGELLGIIIANPGTSMSDITGRLKPYITRWGADPTWSSTIETTGPSIEDFKNISSSDTEVTLEELGDIDATNKYSLSVVGYRADYDEKRGLWYCDIEIDTHERYFPFIRLALARYQPKSVSTIQDGIKKDVRVSRVVLSDIVQLPPSRTLSVTFQSPDRTILDVLISGTGGRGRHEVYTNRIDVSVEKKDSTLHNTDLGWNQIGVTKTESNISPRGTLWHGTIKLPQPSNHTCRLVIKEFERIDRGPHLPISEDERLIYADILEI